MCDAATAMVVASVAGTGLRAFGAHQQGTEEYEQAQRNKAYSNLSAKDATDRGEQEASRARMKGTQTIAQQRVGFGASGVDVSTGSPLEMMADTRLMSELDAQTIRNNAAREAWGYKTQADEYEKASRVAIRRRNYNVAGTVLGGVGDLLAMGAKSSGGSAQSSGGSK